MALVVPQTPNLTVTPPQVANPLDQAQRAATLQDMLTGNRVKQQLAPLQVQEAQNTVAQGAIKTQQDQIALQTQQAQNAYWSDPDSYTITKPTEQPGNDRIAGMLGIAADDPILSMVHGQMKAGVPAPAAIADAKQTLAFRKDLEQTTQEHQKVLNDTLTQVRTIAAPILAQDDPVKKQQMIADALPQLQELAKPNPAISQMLPQLNAQNFNAFANRIGAEESAIEYRQKSADAWKAELANAQTADPLLKMEQNPGEAFSGDKLPASMAYLQAQAKSSNPLFAMRATALLGQAKGAEQVELSIDRQKKEAAQSIADGDPAAAAKLLIDGTVAPNQLISSRKPEFAQKAFTLAAQLQPGWSAQKADADYAVAKSPANVAFFGSAKSLTDKGGTLDQLAAASKDIPGSEIPIINSIADVYKLQTGDPAIAKYATIAWGVADDSAKVQGGGQGSDASRAHTLALFTGKQSPEQRQAAIDATRGTVGSQVTSRIGNNSVLKQMYGGENNAPASSAGTGKTITQAQLAAAAKDHGVSIEEATRQAKAANYTIQ